MRICVAQTRPVKGDVLRNIEQHKRLIDLAAVNLAHIVVFPELSLTGYEPTLARTLATDPGDPRFDDFQTISNTRQITIGVGMPIRTRTGICIGMVLFQPHQPRQTYLKKYLHRDEEAFFVAGEASPVLQIEETKVALAICYELSVDEHSASAFTSGAQVYIASVAKTEKGTDAAIGRLANIAQTYSMTVLMSNCVGESEEGECVGKSSIWNMQGLLVGQLNHEDVAVLLIDTDTGQLLTCRCE
jgi:predicted amidohydrolase